MKKTPQIVSTLQSLRRLDQTLWMLTFQGDYGLDELLRKGVKGLPGLVLYAQRYFRAPVLLRNPGSFGCSTFFARTPAEQVLLGRNFDYKESLALAVWTAPKDGYRSLSVTLGSFLLYGMKWQRLERAGFPLRLMGAAYTCMDGINEKGLAVAVLEIKAKPTAQKRGKTPITTPIALRAILDRCATVEEAIKLLDGFDMQDLIFACYHYQICDAAGGSAVVEYVDGQMHVYQRQPDAQQCLTNFFLTPCGDNRKEMGRDRYANMEERLSACGGVITEAAAMDLLEKNKLYYHHKWMPHMVATVWSAVYNCTERTMTLCAGMNYETAYHFRLDRPGEAEVLPRDKGETL